MQKTKSVEVFDCNSLNGTACQGSDRPKAPLSPQVSAYISIGNLQAPLIKEFLNFEKKVSTNHVQIRRVHSVVWRMIACFVCHLLQTSGGC